MSHTHICPFHVSNKSCSRIICIQNMQQLLNQNKCMTSLHNFIKMCQIIMNMYNMSQPLNQNSRYPRFWAIVEYLICPCDWLSFWSGIYIIIVVTGSNILNFPDVIASAMFYFSIYDTYCRNYVTYLCNWRWCVVCYIIISMNSGHITRILVNIRKTQ